MVDVEYMGGKGKGKKREIKVGKKVVGFEIVLDLKFVMFLYDKMKLEIFWFYEMIKNLNEIVKVVI